MPYRLVIADDEKPIRTGLVKYIDWKTLGFEVVGCFEDGADVLHYLQQNGADVVFSDIKMNRVTGLDIARAVHDNQLPVKVILISGHKEFDFAKEAIGYGVRDYVLKPVRFDEIRKVFTQLKTQLDLEETDRAKKQVEQRQMYDFNWKLRQQLILELMSGHFTDQAAWASLLSVADDDGRLRRSRFSLCELRLPDQEQTDARQLRNAVVAALQRFDRQSALPLETYYLDGTADDEKTTVRLMILLPETAVSDSALLPDHCQDMTDYMKAFLCRAASYAILGTYDTIEQALQQIALGRLDASPSSLPSTTPASSKDDDSPHDSIQKALSYIQKNYNHEMMLQDVAAKVFLNPVYFSRLFKQRTGRNFIDYLTDIRIQAAIEILEKKQKPVRDIGRMVGIADSKYFARLFKRRTGYSPTGYFRR